MRHSFCEFDLFGRSVQAEPARRAREAASRKRARLTRCATLEYAMFAKISEKRLK